jgi:hypothetical protein
MRTSESKGHQQLYDSSAAFEPEVRKLSVPHDVCKFRVRGTSAQYRGEVMITKQDRMLTMAVAARAMTRRPGF